MKQQYLHHLLKKNSTKFIFFLITGIVFGLVPYLGKNTSSDPQYTVYVSIWIVLILNFVIAITLIVSTFRFVHQKKSVDVYFALPVKRKDMLISSMLMMIGFSWIALLTGIFLPWLIGGCQAYSFVEILRICAYALFACLEIYVLYTCFFLVANNVTDGLVMMVAYTLFPVLLGILFSSFHTHMVANGHVSAFYNGLVNLVSPLRTHFNHLMTFTSKPGQYGGLMNLQFTYSWRAVLSSIILTILAGYGIVREFVYRKPERAEQISDNTFAYPIVIHLYLYISLLILSFGVVSPAFWAQNAISFTGFLHVFMYPFVFVAFIVACSIYQRKFTLNLSSVGNYIAAVLITIVCSTIVFRTHLLGYANSYHTDFQDGIIYTYNVYYHENAKPAKFQFVIREDQVEKYASDISLLEEYRQENINLFYDHPKDETIGHLRIEPLHPTSMNDSQSFQCDLRRPLTIEELEQINQHTIVTIVDLPIGKDFVAGESVSGEYIRLDEYLKQINKK